MRLLKSIVSRMPWRRRWSQKFWGNATEVVFDAILVWVSVVILVWSLVGQIQAWPGYSPLSPAQWATRLVLCSGLLTIGGFRLLRMLFLHSGSAEQRSRMLQRAFDLDYLKSESPANQQLPSIPGPPVQLLSSGSRLRFRLHFVRQSFWRLAGLAAFSLLMVIVTTVNGAVIWGDLRFGQVDRIALTSVLMLAMSWLTVWLVWQTGKTLVRQVRLGPTIVEVSQHPLRIGQDCQLFLRQLGDIHLEQLKVMIECVEESTYQQGTDIRSERRIVYCQTLACFQNVDLSTGNRGAEKPVFGGQAITKPNDFGNDEGPSRGWVKDASKATREKRSSESDSVLESATRGPDAATGSLATGSLAAGERVLSAEGTANREQGPKRSRAADYGAGFQASLAFEIPVDAMHSFRAKNNQIRWRITVSGENHKCPEFNRDFPITVHPHDPAR